MPFYQPNTYTIPSGIKNEAWIRDFPSQVPACIPFLGRYQPDSYVSNPTGYQIDDAWPPMVNAITLPNAVGLMNYTTATVGMTATANFDWAYTGFSSGDVNAGSFDISYSNSYAYTGIPSWGAPIASVAGNSAATVRFINNPLQAWNLGAGGFNYPTWSLIVNGSDFEPDSGVFVSSLGFEVARNESGNAFRVRSLFGGAISVQQDAYATVTDAVYDGDGNVTTPTQFSFYTVTEGAGPLNEDDDGFGTVQVGWSIVDNLSGYGGSPPAASGTLTVAGVNFGWVAQVSSSLGFGITFSQGSVSVSPTLTFSD